MSQTVSVGVVGPSHWAYMASVMAAKLQQMVHTACYPLKHLRKEHVQ